MPATALERIRLALFPLLLLTVLLGAVHWIYSQSIVESRHSLSPQSRTNLSFAASGVSLQGSLPNYPGVWTPLYPLVLRGAHRAGVPLVRVNQLLLYLTLAWLFWFVRARLRGVDWWWPMAFFCLASFSYNNASQFVPENLFVPLCLFFFSALASYGRRPGWPGLLAVSLLGAAAAGTKYIGLFWLVPLGALRMLWAPRVQLSTRLIHVLVFVLVAALPVGSWMSYQMSRTGFVTGMDRSRVRAPDPGTEALTSPLANVRLTLKTLQVDFLDPTENADHATINQPRPVAWSAWLFALLIGTGLALQARRLAALGRRAVSSGWGGWLRVGRSEPGQLFEFAASYLALLVVLWSMGNNDPIYTRFVIPAYGFLGLLGFALFGKLVEGETRWWARAPWWLALGLLVGVQLHKSVVLQRIVHTGAWS